MTTRPFLDELWDRYQSGDTGVLEVRAADIETIIYLRDGVPVSAGAGFMGQNIGRVLLAQGLIDESQHQQIIEAMSDRLADAPQTRFGEVAVSLGIVTLQQIEAALAEQVRQRVMHCVQWTDSECEFSSTAEELEGVVEYPCLVEPLIFEGVQHYLDADQLDELLLDAEAQYVALRTAPEDIAREFGLDPAALNFLSGLDGTSSLDETLCDAEIDVIAAQRYVVALRAMGHILLSDVPEPIERQPPGSFSINAPALSPPAAEVGAEQVSPYAPTAIPSGQAAAVETTAPDEPATLSLEADTISLETELDEPTLPPVSQVALPPAVEPSASVHAAEEVRANDVPLATGEPGEVVEISADDPRLTGDEPGEIMEVSADDPWLQGDEPGEVMEISADDPWLRGEEPAEVLEVSADDPWLQGDEPGEVMEVSADDPWLQGDEPGEVMEVSADDPWLRGEEPAEVAQVGAEAPPQVRPSPPMTPREEPVERPGPAPPVQTAPSPTPPAAVEPAPEPTPSPTAAQPAASAAAVPPDAQPTTEPPARRRRLRPAAKLSPGVVVTDGAISLRPAPTSVTPMPRAYKVERGRAASRPVLPSQKPRAVSSSAPPRSSGRGRADRTTPSPSPSTSVAPAAAAKEPVPQDPRKAQLEAEKAFRKGKRLERRGQTRHAIDALRRAHELHPEALEYELHLLWAELTLTATADKGKKLRERLGEVAAQAIRQDRRMAFGHYIVGQLAMIQGEHEVAMRAFGRAAKLDPNDEEASRLFLICKRRVKR